MKNYLVFQILATVFLAYVIFKLIKKIRNKGFNFKEGFFWIIFWLAVGVAFWLPQSTSFLANLLGIGRGVDLAIYVSLFLLFYLIFRIYITLDRQQMEITKIIRHLAINDDKKDQEEKKN